MSWTHQRGVRAKNPKVVSTVVIGNRRIQIAGPASDRAARRAPQLETQPRPIMITGDLDAEQKIMRVSVVGRISLKTVAKTRDLGIERGHNSRHTGTAELDTQCGRAMEKIVESLTDDFEESVITCDDFEGDPELISAERCECSGIIVQLPKDALVSKGVSVDTAFAALLDADGKVSLTRTLIARLRGKEF